MPAFWQRSHESVENLLTFAVNTCGNCARLWDPDLRPAARPFCVFNSHLIALAQKRSDAGAPFDTDLPEWFPTNCATHVDK